MTFSEFRIYSRKKDAARQKVRPLKKRNNSSSKLTNKGGKSAAAMHHHRSKSTPFLHHPGTPQKPTSASHSNLPSSATAGLPVSSVGSGGAGIAHRISRSAPTTLIAVAASPSSSAASSPSAYGKDATGALDEEAIAAAKLKAIAAAAPDPAFAASRSMAAAGVGVTNSSSYASSLSLTSSSFSPTAVTSQKTWPDGSPAPLAPGGAGAVEKGRRFDRRDSSTAPTRSRQPPAIGPSIDAEELGLLS